MNTALLIIDIQNDYFPGGAMELVGAEAAAERAASVLAVFRARGLPVVHVQHLSVRPGATFFRPGTPGAEIHPSVAPLADETVVLKHYPNAFRETGLLEHLRGKGIERLVIAGMMTHMCIDTTTRAAADLGFECTLVHDACATRALSFGGETIPAASVHNAFVAALNGTFAKVESSDRLIGTL
ncbi:MAG: cysteine hydrolase [Burkholderiaceae bacterium]|nr:cysteine hydrolase [Burkholderiaceae bacterium]